MLAVLNQPEAVAVILDGIPANRFEQVLLRVAHRVGVILDSIYTEIKAWFAL